MNIMLRACRGFLFLILSGCLLGVAVAGHAEALTVTPATPQAYQPFTLSVEFICLTGDELTDVQTYVFPDTHSILLATNNILGCFPEDPGVPRMASISGLPGGTYSIQGKTEYLDSDEPPYVSGEITIGPAPPVQSVYAFRNSKNSHYFITAGTAEKDSLLSGGGGGGWYLVDEGFHAWPADGPAPAAARPVCRFYSAAVNSHFYTAGPNECELLKQPGSGWTYEGIAFRALVPTKGSCYPGTTPVWRLYNDRFAQADSNHRFAASADTYRHMMANGWIGEGVAFCSPPA